MATIEKPTWKAFVPTLIMAGIAVTTEVVYPLLQGNSLDVHWYDFVSVFVVAVANLVKQDDNPVRFWDSTIVGALIGAVLQWLVVSFTPKPPVFDIKQLILQILPPLVVLAGSFSRGFSKGYQSEEGGT